MISIKDILYERLKHFSLDDEEYEKQAVKEITQELILYSLSKVSFFDKGLFHGGTSLRILFGIDRFSEDLDFSLQTN